MSALALICAMLVITCQDPNIPLNPSPEPQQGYGTVSINFGGGNTRTLLPSEIDITKLHYTLNFTRTDGSGNLTETQNGSGQLTLQLNIGAWNLVIRGYNSASDATDTAKALVSYTQNGIVIPYGDSVTINAKLLPNLDNLTQNGSGTLRYDITFPAGAAGVLKVYTHPANTLAGGPVVLSAAENRGSLELASGYYDISVNMEYQGKIKIWSELAHINDNAITEAVVGPDDFTDYLPPPGPVDIYLSMDKFSMTDEGAGIFSDMPPIALDKRTEDTRTIAVDSLVAVEWRVGDAVLGTGNSITLNGASFPMGTYTLNLTFIKDGKPWLGSLMFTIADFIQMNLQLTEENWRNILVGIAEITEAGRYVSLDLSACTCSESNTGGGLRSDGTFDHLPNFNEGKDKIVSLILPDTATSIAGWNGVSGGKTYSFRDFSNLRTVSGENVANIGWSAFMDCTTLINANFPVATYINPQAFENCVALTSVSFSAAATIGRGDAFGNCTSLTSFNLIGDGSLSTMEDGRALVKNGTELVSYPSASGPIEMSVITRIGSYAFHGAALTSVNFPNAVNTGDSAFMYCHNLVNVNFPEALIIDSQSFIHCTNLTSVNVPKATEIGSYAFRSWYLTTPLTITLGKVAPILSFGILDDIRLIVTVKVPSEATGYGPIPATYSGTDDSDNWGNAFRGKGWDGTSYGIGWGEVYGVNSYVTLQIEY